MRHILRRHEILGYLYTIVKVTDLVRSTGRHEHCIAQALYNGVSASKGKLSFFFTIISKNITINIYMYTKGHNLPFDAVFAVQSFSQRTIEITTLIVDWIVMRFQTSPTLQRDSVQQISYFVGVSSCVNMPQRARCLSPFADTSACQYITAGFVYRS